MTFEKFITPLEDKNLLLSLTSFSNIVMQGVIIGNYEKVLKQAKSKNTSGNIISPGVILNVTAVQNN